jgi:hypothetical protein
MVQVAEHLLCKHKHLNLNPSPTKKRSTENKEDRKAWLYGRGNRNGGRKEGN